MMNEGYYVLAVAMLAPKQLYPEEARELFDTGIMPKRNLKTYAWDMHFERTAGTTWSVISDMYGMSMRDGINFIARYKRKGLICSG